jgi:hypothetical protein
LPEEDTSATMQFTKQEIAKNTQAAQPAPKVLKRLNTNEDELSSFNDINDAIVSSSFTEKYSNDGIDEVVA